MSEFFNTLIGLSVLEQQEANSRNRVEQYGRDLEMENQLRNQQFEINRLRNEASGLPAPSGREMDLERRVQELESMERLLSLPMLEIARRNPAFKDTYLRQQEIMAQWIVSQRSYKEIAMKYGQALGKTPEQIAAEAKQTEELVKNGLSEFDNNVDSETVNALGYAEKRQKQIDEIQRKADEERFKQIEKSLVRWKEEAGKRELMEDDFQKINNLKSRLEELKIKLGK